jgi:hypothetical protein
MRKKMNTKKLVLGFCVLAAVTAQSAVAAEAALQVMDESEIASALVSQDACLFPQPQTEAERS